jgi:hypothetical protein
MSKWEQVENVEKWCCGLGDQICWEIREQMIIVTDTRLTI